MQVSIVRVFFFGIKYYTDSKKQFFQIRLVLENLKKLTFIFTLSLLYSY